MTKNEIKGRNLIVFDMDGVLVDVSRSYRDAVRQTARLFFRGAHNWKSLPDPLFSLSDLARVKQSGGLNNDWDLTATVISLLLSRVEMADPAHNDDAAALHRKATSALDVTALARYLENTPRPLATLMAKNGNSNHPFASAMYKGDVGSGNIIKQIFQEIYLGKDLFESTYNMAAGYFRGDGLILREALLVHREDLNRLAQTNLLAIATGRPEAEAAYPLELHDLRKYFGAVVSLDQCLEKEKEIFLKENRKVSLSKPDPYMLDLIADINSHQQIEKYYYVGDMPDDMMAASRSNFGYTGIGVLWSAPNPEDLQKKLEDAGAKHIVETITELEKLFSSAFLPPNNERGDVNHNTQKTNNKQIPMTKIPNSKLNDF
jgi:HAD superfamily phosphatase